MERPERCRIAQLSLRSGATYQIFLPFEQKGIRGKTRKQVKMINSSRDKIPAIYHTQSFHHVVKPRFYIESMKLLFALFLMGCASGLRYLRALNLRGVLSFPPLVLSDFFTFWCRSTLM